MTWKEMLSEGTEALLRAEVEDASWDAWLLLEYVSGWNRADYFLKQQENVSSEKIKRYRQLIKKRCCHIPLQHLTGSQEFMGLELHVNGSVLIPRQDTELLVEKVLPKVLGKRVLDMCTGSGCIAIALSVLGTPLLVEAADLSEEALQLARSNAQRLGAQVTFFRSNLFGQVRGKYDVIVSNPPYIATDVIKTLMPEVREYEPVMALDGGADGLEFYRQIAGQAGAYLNPDGMVWVEIGYDQKESVCDLFRENGFGNVECCQDLCGRDRIVSASLE